MNSCSFISVIAHWINEDFIFYDAAVITKHFPGSHTW